MEPSADLSVAVAWLGIRQFRLLCRRGWSAWFRLRVECTTCGCTSAQTLGDVVTFFIEGRSFVDTRWDLEGQGLLRRGLIRRFVLVACRRDKGDTALVVSSREIECEHQEGNGRSDVVRLCTRGILRGV